MKKFSPYSIIRSFGYAVRGIFYALTRERNLRIHFAAGAFALYLSRYYTLSKAELGLLLLCVGFVPVCEMMNTAIEKTVDIETPSYHYLAAIAKDVAAGAVLVSALTSVAIGFLLFWDIPTLQLVWQDCLRAPLPRILALLAAAVWIIAPQTSNRSGGGKGGDIPPPQ